MSYALGHSWYKYAVVEAAHRSGWEVGYVSTRQVARVSALLKRQRRWGIKFCFGSSNQAVVVGFKIARRNKSAYQGSLRKLFKTQQPQHNHQHRRAKITSPNNSARSKCMF